MMQPIVKVTIPEPCHQQWDDMTQAANGRFCASCSKTVVDFTSMTDQQVIDYLSTATNVCGRISALQFSSVNNQIQTSAISPGSIWKRLILAVTMFAVMHNVKSQTNSPKPATEQTSVRITLGKIVVPAKVATPVIITGTVVDKHGIPLAGIKIKAGNKEFVTAINGVFNLDLPAGTPSFTVEGNFSWFKQTIKIKKNKATYKVVLKPNDMVLGRIAVTNRTSLLKQFYQRYLINPVKVLVG